MKNFTMKVIRLLINSFLVMFGMSLILFVLLSVISKAQKVEICHIPPGNPQNAHTIDISINALNAHLAHDDFLGACDGAIEEDDRGLNLQILPNPYVDQVAIKYDLNESYNLKMEVYNQIGNKIQTIVNESQLAGKYEYAFNAKSLGHPAGIYVLKISASGEKNISRTVKLLELSQF